MGSIETYLNSVVIMSPKSSIIEKQMIVLKATPIFNRRKNAIKNFL